MMHFATTPWAAVLTASGGDTRPALEARERICRDYWRPLHAYLVRSGYSAHDAEDLVQQFLLEFLEHDGLGRVDPSRGRFRSYLVASLRNFLGHQRERAAARKRGGGLTVVSMDDPGADVPAPSDSVEDRTAEFAFDRQWAWAILERSRRRLEAEYIASGREAEFELLSRHLPGGASAGSHAETARRLGMTPGAVKTEVYRLRQRYGQYLRAEVGQTVESPAEIDDELRHLLALFSARSHGLGEA